MNHKTKYPKAQLKQQARQKYIEENMLYMTQEELAKALNVDRSTIRRDLETWYNNKGFRQFIIAQFIENYGKAKTQEKPIKLLDRIITMFKYLPQEDIEEAIDRTYTWDLSKANQLKQQLTKENKEKIGEARTH